MLNLITTCCLKYVYKAMLCGKNSKGATIFAEQLIILVRKYLICCIFFAVSNSFIIHLSSATKELPSIFGSMPSAANSSTGPRLSIHLRWAHECLELFIYFHQQYACIEFSFQLESILGASILDASNF